MLPAAFIALYGTAVILLQSLVTSAGADGRAVEQAALAKKFGTDADGLHAALKGLSAEPEKFRWARVAFAALALICVQAYRSAQIPDHSERVILEPVVTALVFAAWAIAAPGTFLAAWQSPTTLAATTITVAFGAAIALWVMSSSVLNRPKTTPPAPPAPPVVL